MNFVARVALICALAMYAVVPLAWALPTEGQRGMVSSAHPLASDAGVQMLRAGGNAVDAAVATAFALAVVEPYSSGLGGGGFALVHAPANKAPKQESSAPRFFDFREVAPQKATRDMYMVNGKADPARSQDGILSAGVPGAVKGYIELHEKFGKLPRAKVLAPAIALAERGFVIDTRYQAYMGSRGAILDPEASRIFSSSLLPGQKLVQKDLAQTLKAIAKNGAAVFYEGAIAKKLVADMQARGGIITLDDLKSYKVVERAPLSATWGSQRVYTAPPPSAGGQVVLTLINIMMAQGLSKEPWHSAKELHAYIEASKRAFADRHLIGDPAFVPDPTPALVTQERAQKLAKRVGASAEAALNIPPGQDAVLPANVVVPKIVTAPRAGNDTTHLCVIDRDGNAVSLTTTLNYGFGSGVVAKDTGVLWNDEMDDFAIAPGVPNVYGVVGSEANAIAPGKRPVSSMSPTLLFEQETGDVTLCVGSPGGPRIPTTVVQALWYKLRHDFDVQRAIDTPRIHHQHLPDHVSLEPFALEPATVALLQKMGHVLKEEMPWSNATIIEREVDGTVRGAADRRGVGAAVAE